MGNPSIPALRLYYFIESRHGRIKFGNSVNMSHQIYCRNTNGLSTTPTVFDLEGV